MKNFLYNENRDILHWVLSFLFIIFLYFGLLFLNYKATAIVCFSISGVSFILFIILEVSKADKTNVELIKIKSFAFFSLFSFSLFFFGTWLLSLAIPVFSPSWLKTGIAFALSLLLPLVSFLISLYQKKKYGHH